MNFRSILAALFCLVLSQSAMGQQYPLKDYCVAWDGKRLVTAVCYEPIDESGLPILTPRWIPMVEANGWWSGVFSGNAPVNNSGGAAIWEGCVTELGADCSVSGVDLMGTRKSPEPSDVPAIQFMCGRPGLKATPIPECARHPMWTCADRARILLHSEDGKSW